MFCNCSLKLVHTEAHLILNARYDNFANWEKNYFKNLKIILKNWYVKNIVFHFTWVSVVDVLEMYFCVDEDNVMVVGVVLVCVMDTVVIKWGTIEVILVVCAVDVVGVKVVIVMIVVEVLFCVDIIDVNKWGTIDVTLVVCTFDKVEVDGFVVF